MTRELDCGSHGKRPWHGEVICAQDAGGCGRVWKLQHDADVPPAQLAKSCVCLKPLSGPKGTARAICAECYLERKAQAS